MVDSITAISAYNNVGKMVGGIDSYGDQDSVNFSQLLNAAVGETAQAVRSAENASVGALKGTVTLDELAITVANAEMTLRTVVAVRDRIINAYQDIIKMPI